MCTDHGESEKMRVEASPPPVQLVESMRDIGYSLDTALADLVDNSITADATLISIRSLWNHGQPWLFIQDDGHGMSHDALKNAMVLGSADPRQIRSQNDLGRFGLGMKTASFSQCRKLTVYSWQREGAIAGRQWDLGFIETNPEHGWAVKVFSELQDDHRLLPINMVPEQGTVVIWEEMDRFGSAGGEQEYNRQICQAMSHLGLIFHRFLKPETGQKIAITFNMDKVDSFDPFNKVNPATISLPEQSEIIDGQEIVIEPFVLPHHAKTANDEYERYEGERGYLRNQGFYVYRNKRLIIHGTWFRLIKQGELTKLVRVKVDIPNTLDHVWNINVMKSSAHPPPVIRDVLKRVIPRIMDSGTRVYRARGRRVVSSKSATAWIRREAKGKIGYEVDREHPLFRQIMHELDSNEVKSLFSAYLSLLESSFPIDAIFSDVATNPKEVCQPDMAEEQVSEVISAFVSELLESGKKSDEVRGELVKIPQFSQKLDVIDEVLSRYKERSAG